MTAVNAMTNFQSTDVDPIQNKDDRLSKSESHYNSEHLSNPPTQIESFQGIEVLRLRRKTYTHDEVEEAYPPQTPEEKQPRELPKPSECCLKYSIVPALRFAQTYDFKRFFLLDLVNGFTVACLHLPQGLAYGLLASLTPLSGVYTSIFSVSIYVLFGTVPHMSMGTNAVLSLVVAPMVEREANKLMLTPKRDDGDVAGPATLSTNGSSVQESDGAEALMELKLGVAMTATCMVGLILLLMGMLRMGFLTNYMPSSFVGGFTAAAAVHIALSQMKHVFHIQVPTHSGPGKVILTMRDIIKGIGGTNLADTIVSLASGAFLVAFEQVLNPIVRKKTGHILPTNMILVVIGATVSHTVNLAGRWNVAVIGPVSGGFPVPSLPLLKPGVVTAVLLDSVIQAVIVFSMSISMAMLTAKLHSYSIDSNAELIAYGACNFLSSFFPVQTSSVSPPRSMILSNGNAQTTFHGIPTALTLLLGGTVLSPLFQPLPIPTLAAMIVMAVFGIILQIRHVPSIWRISVTDFIVWITTWLSTLFIDVHYGLAIGVITAALGFMVNNQYIKGEVVVLSTREDLLIPGSSRVDTAYMPRTQIFYFPSQLFFANAESFRQQLFEQVFDPTKAKPLTDGEDIECQAPSDIDFIILDCSAMTYIDIDGLNMLKSIVLRYHNVGVRFMLARCPHTTMRTLERGEFFDLVPRWLVFHEVADALARGADFKIDRHGFLWEPEHFKVTKANMLAHRISSSIM